MLARACSGAGRQIESSWSEPGVDRADLRRPAAPRPGHRVDVLARDLPLETTSVVAAALWYPYRALPAGPGHRLGGRRRTPRFARARGATRTPGSRMLPGTEVLHEPDAGPLVGSAPCRTWSASAPPTGTPTRGRSPRRSSTCRSTCAGCATRLDELGGTLTRISLAALAADRRRRGQLRRARVAPARGGPRRAAGARPGRARRAGRPRPLVARLGRADVRRAAAATVVVGGTDEAGRLEPDTVPGDGRPRSSERAARLVPELAGATCVGHRVGLRPVRPVGAPGGRGPGVHCYGQGGAGVTLSWGCADEVAALVPRLPEPRVAR